MSDFEEVGVERDPSFRRRSFLRVSGMIGAAALASGLSFPAIAQQGDRSSSMGRVSGRRKLNLGAVDVALTESDIAQISDAASKLSLEGERLPEAALKMTGL